MNLESLLATCLFLLALSSNLYADQDLLITNVRILDGRGLQDSPVSILIEDGWITQIKPGIEGTDDFETLDADGFFVIPGLIDAHVHLSMSPGSGWRDDSLDTQRRLLERLYGAWWC